MRLELTAGRLFGLAGPLQKAPQPKQRSPARGGPGWASQQQGARGPVAQRPRHRRTPAPRFMSSLRFDDDRPVTCTLLRFGRVCPRVGSEWRASLQYPVAADPKISEGQPVLSAERCSSECPGRILKSGRVGTKQLSLCNSESPRDTGARSCYTRWANLWLLKILHSRFAICTQRCAPRGGGGGKRRRQP